MDLGHGTIDDPLTPLPAGFHEALALTEGRALDALPVFKDAIDEACEEFARSARRAGVHGRFNVVAFRRPDDREMSNPSKCK